MKLFSSVFQLDLILDLRGMIATSPEAQFGHEHVDDIGFEPVAIDGAVQHYRCDHASYTTARKQRVVLR